MYYRPEPSRATDTAREIWSERYIHSHVYRHTYSNTHTLMQTDAEYRYLFLYFEKMYFEYFCALKVAAIC